MPNTLAHVGIQGLLTRAAFPTAQVKWICLGCVIPDIPWIMQRVLRELPLGLSAYDVRLYAIVQSTLLFCVVLSAACAALAKRPLVVFAILAGNSLGHLIIDASQTKWANGVHLFAPLSWELLNFGWYWPESPTTLVLTGIGLVYLLSHLFRQRSSSSAAVMPRWRRAVLATGLLVAYAFAPIALTAGPAGVDNHSVRTLREVAQRTGRPVELDRAGFRVTNAGARLETFAREQLAMTAVATPNGEQTTVSIKGVFVDPSTVHVLDWHWHEPGLRDLASYLGLGLVLVLWCAPYALRILALRRSVNGL